MVKVKFSIDGYSVAERLLEGVMFDVIAVDNSTLDTVDFEILSVSSRPGDEDYLKLLNLEHWLQEVKDFAEDILTEGLLGEFDYEVLEENV